MPDVQKQISSVHRSTSTRDREGVEAQVSTMSQVFDTGIDDLWDAVTSAERIPRWFLPISGELRQGGRYQFQGHAGGTISRCEKPTGFAATWEAGDDVSWIEVRLTPEGDNRTRLELEHTGHPKAEFWEQFGPGAAGLGWDSILLGVALHVSSAESAVKPEDAAAWMGTDEGKQFLRLSADAWADAAVAAGADPTVARERADRCYAAYTGGA